MSTQNYDYLFRIGYCICLQFAHGNKTLFKNTIDPNEPPPLKVIHPRLGLGTSPRIHEDKTNIEYSFATGKIGIKTVPIKEKST